MTKTKSIEQMLAEDGLCVSGITGESMLPMLRRQTDRVLLLRATFPLQPDSVAVYKRGQDYILHRVLRYENGVYYLRGDNCIAEEAVPEEQILGVLSGFWRGETYHDCTGAENAAWAARARKTLPIRRLRAALTTRIRRSILRRCLQAERSPEEHDEAK